MIQSIINGTRINTNKICMSTSIMDEQRIFMLWVNKKVDMCCSSLDINVKFTEKINGLVVSFKQLLNVY